MGDVNSWGRLGAPRHRLVDLSGRVDIAERIRESTPGLAYGMGRSYGDVCLNPGGTLWRTRSLDRLLSFDPRSGELRCEAGVLLREIQQVMLPQGWALPVTPGTQMVTVGGAIANDVHGKNHHGFGSFGDHLQSFRLIRSDGSERICSPTENPELFAATIGGLGLTGVIADARLKLRPLKGPWLDSEIIPFSDLPEFARLAEESGERWEHTVAWIDCVGHGAGRGLFMRANWAADQSGVEPRPKDRRMPLVPPVSLVNPLSLRLLNESYFRVNSRQRGLKRAHYVGYFYPLDSIQDWNRAYGPAGFYQYQCAVPPQAMAAIQAMLDEIARSGQGSFLAVLKTFGARAPRGLLSFPMPGITLALDFPNQGQRTLSLLDRLDAILVEAKGRIYPAKDARMSRRTFRAGYPQLEEFLRYRDPGIDSALSRRLI